MHPILTISKFELSKKKVAFKPAAIIGLLVVFLLFSSAFFLLSNLGYKPKHDYYPITTAGGAIDAYIASANSMRLVNTSDSTNNGKDNSIIQIYPRVDGSYFVDSQNKFEQLAATTALVKEIRLQNRQLLLSSGADPPFLVLLNITTRHREEILNSPESGEPSVDQSNSQSADSAQGDANNTNIHGTRVTQEDRSTVTVLSRLQNSNSGSVGSDSSMGNNALSDSVIDGSTTNSSNSTTLVDANAGENNVTEASAISLEPLNSSAQTPLETSAISTISNITFYSRHGLNASSVASAIPDGLTYPDDINTLLGVKYLFVLIQLMLVFNFFSALLGNSFFEEKLNYRSSLLFSAPLPRRFIVIGKLLPYLILSFVFSSILVGLQYPYLLAQPLFYFLVLVMALVYFSLSFLNGLLARSNKEYSFLNVFTTSILSLYLLIPAFIANYSTLGYASLLTPILLLAQQLPVSLSLVLFLGTIYAALAAVIFIMGSALWNFEHLYKYESPLKKIMYIIRTNTKSAWQYFVYGICCVPFLWLAEIILIALFLVVPLQNKVFLLLYGAALCEEFVRTLASRAHILHARASPSTLPSSEPTQSWKQAFLVGLGFGLTEKVILFAAIAPYLQGYQLIAMSTTFAPAGIHAHLGYFLSIVLIVMAVCVPIAIHTVLTYLFSFCMRKYDWCARRANLLCMGLALLHATFNYVVLTYAGASII